jgi:hypothetical protein
MVSGTMRDDRGHLRLMRLLPFAAAAVDSLTLSMQTSGGEVYAGQSGWSASRRGPLKGHSGQCGCCTFLLHLHRSGCCRAWEPSEETRRLEMEITNVIVSIVAAGSWDIIKPFVNIPSADVKGSSTGTLQVLSSNADDDPDMNLPITGARQQSDAGLPVVEDEPNIIEFLSAKIDTQELRLIHTLCGALRLPAS